MKRTVWDRLDGASQLGSEWEGDDAPTNVAPPEFARETPKRGDAAAFWKGVVVGAGVLTGVGLFGVGAAAGIGVAVYGLPSLPAAPAEIAIATRIPAPVEPPAPQPVPEVEARVVVTPPVQEIAALPVATSAPAIVVATPAPAPVVIATPAPRPAAVAKRAPAPKVVAKRAAPAVARKAPAVREPRPIETHEVVVDEIDLVDAPVPAATPASAPVVAKPNRAELLELALAAKQAATPAPKVVAAKPAPTPYAWDAPAAESSQEDEKWFPVDDTGTEASASSGSADADIFGD